MYSIKVWLTCVLAAPLFYSIIQFCTNPSFINNDDVSLYTCLMMYLVFVVAQLIFSLLTWLIFSIFSMIVIAINIQPVVRKVILSAIGITLTLATFKVLFFNDEFSIDNEFIVLAGIDCICITWGSWFYKLEKLIN